MRSLRCLVILPLLWAGGRAAYCKSTAELLGRGNRPFSAAFAQGRLLGRGGFGEVRAVEYQGRQLALKKIRKHWDMQQLANEISINLALDGVQDISHIFGCEETPSHVFLGIERLFKDLADPETAAGFLALPRLQRLAAYAGFAAALAAVHRAGFVHSDVKPPNLMAADASLRRLKLIDFGVTVPLNAPAAGGTLVFLPPERVDGSEPRARAVQDTWAFAVTVLALEAGLGLLTRFVPDRCFLGRMDPACHAQLLSNAQFALHSIYGDSMFSRMLLRCLALQPDARPSMLELLDGFAQIEKYSDNLQLYKTDQRRLQALAEQERQRVRELLALQQAQARFERQDRVQNELLVRSFRRGDLRGEADFLADLRRAQELYRDQRENLVLDVDMDIELAPGPQDDAMEEELAPGPHNAMDEEMPPVSPDYQLTYVPPGDRMELEEPLEPVPTVNVDSIASSAVQNYWDQQLYTNQNPGPSSNAMDLESEGELPGRDTDMKQAPQPSAFQFSFQQPYRQVGPNAFQFPGGQGSSFFVNHLII